MRLEIRGHSTQLRYPSVTLSIVSPKRVDDDLHVSAIDDRGVTASVNEVNGVLLGEDGWSRHPAESVRPAPESDERRAEDHA